jgi:hypothetical protein
MSTQGLAEYLRLQGARVTDIAGDVVHWAADNRQAWHIGVRLESMGFDVAPGAVPGEFEVRRRVARRPETEGAG